MHFQQGTFAVNDENAAIQGCWERGGFVRLDKPGTISVVAPVDTFNAIREFLTGKPAPVEVEAGSDLPPASDEIPDEGNG